MISPPRPAAAKEKGTLNPALPTKSGTVLCRHFDGLIFDRVLVKTVTTFGMQRGVQSTQRCRREQGLLARLEKVSETLFVFIV